MKTNLEKHKHYQKKSRYQFCEIPNDEEGQQLVKLMKKYLNKHRYKMLGNGWTVAVISHIMKNMEK